MTQAPVNNIDLAGLSDQLQARALEDFGFYASYVVGLTLSEDILTAVEHSARTMSDVLLSPTYRKNDAARLFSALCLWFRANGMSVSVDASDNVTPTETHIWLFGEQNDGHVAFNSGCVSLRLHDCNVTLSWPAEGRREDAA